MIAHADLDPGGVVYANLLCVFGGDLAKQFRLQFRQPRQPAAHRAAEVMLRQPVCGEHMREFSRRHPRVRILWYFPDFGGWIRLLTVDDVGDR